MSNGTLLSYTARPYRLWALCAQGPRPDISVFLKFCIETAFLWKNIRFSVKTDICFKLVLLFFKNCIFGYILSICFFEHINTISKKQIILSICFFEHINTSSVFVENFTWTLFFLWLYVTYCNNFWLRNLTFHIYLVTQFL